MGTGGEGPVPRTTYERDARRLASSTPPTLSHDAAAQEHSPRCRAKPEADTLWVEPAPRGQISSSRPGPSSGSPPPPLR
eukprot:CAMPEP_0183356450 /NCGR_PEP_ID=MMETSP0164_2-20130417/44433_1 /TAXON_ID=221442 /ORGANISM="Coccolithus pelagicus ssp braarudi, Strain PLY182g" /LENGTH=78 /DNA_ID=CAMNT_0025529867 /DNA_START=213 /DNA_END=450 /DNA_ORIENTATION=+